MQVAVQGATHHTPRPPRTTTRAALQLLHRRPLFDCVFYSQRYAKDSKGTEAIRGNGSIFLGPTTGQRISKGCECKVCDSIPSPRDSRPYSIKSNSQKKASILYHLDLRARRSRISRKARGICVVVPYLRAPTYRVIRVIDSAGRWRPDFEGKKSCSREMEMDELEPAMEDVGMGWSRVTEQDGAVYYWHEASEQSRWEPPPHSTPNGCGGARLGHRIV